MSCFCELEELTHSKYSRNAGSGSTIRYPKVRGCSSHQDANDPLTPHVVLCCLMFSCVVMGCEVLLFFAVLLFWGFWLIFLPEMRFGPIYTLSMNIISSNRLVPSVITCSNFHPLYTPLRTLHLQLSLLRNHTYSIPARS